MADFGADVVKVEHPRGGGGPALDRAGQPTGGTSSFLAVNRGKRSIAVDLATVDGKSSDRAVAASADVLLDNFKTGGLARYRLDDPALSAINPRLIYCSVRRPRRGRGEVRRVERWPRSTRSG